MLASGEVYTGEWMMGVWQGHGSYTWKDESGVVGSYRGEWDKGLKQGQGQFILSSGERYEGQWTRGEKHGRGVWVGDNADRYDGEWDNGQRHGEGRYDWASGEVDPGSSMYYEGQWYRDQRHGEGSFIRTTTSTGTESYTGQWASDRYHGNGIYRAKEKTYVGLWANGERQTSTRLIESGSEDAR